MKISMILAAAAMATGTIAAAPANAQRYDDHRGYDRYDRGDRYDRYDRYEGRRHDRDDRRFYAPRRYGYGYRAGYGYRDRGYGYGYRGGYGRGRVVCRIERGYYGPVRTCFRR